MKTVLTPLIPSPVGRGETKPDRRPPSPERRGGQGVRTPERRRGLRVRSRPLAALAALVVATGCRSAPPTGRYDPAHDLGTLFHDVQLSGIFEDSKTFADARPRLAPAEITARYGPVRGAPQFNLRQFVEKHFEVPRPVGEGFRSVTSQTMEQHIRALWSVLTRPPDTADARSSLIPLPNPYVVPGGRFREVYYWDSYFTMLGLVASGRTDLVKSMLDNFAHLIGTLGHITNGNRTYYLSRSQPPFFAAMVGLYARATDTTQVLPYLDALEAEHAYWMNGAERLAPGAGQAYRRVVRLSDGGPLLNRYWDDRADPRPESYRPDYEVGQTLADARREGFYRNVRATAESGWDFSSRWMRDPKDLRTLETTDLVPVDLNSLLYLAERMIAALRAVRGRAGDAGVARQFAEAAEDRRRALLAAAYDPATGFFYDVRWRSGERVTDRPTLAAASPLYFGLATPEQGRAVAARLEREFLKPGGFVTTLIASGQQWDAPNGWPPLEWLAIEGVRRYGRTDLADAARDRWLAVNRRTYRSTGKMMEKYDVVDLNRRAGGGEYPTQDGFGWTNGVALALLKGLIPPDGQPDRRADEPHHAVGLHEVAPLFAGPRIDVFGQEAVPVAAGEHVLEQGARLFPSAQRGECVDVPEGAHQKCVLWLSEVVRLDVAEHEVAAAQLALDGADRAREPRVVIGQEPHLGEAQQAGVERVPVHRGHEALPLGIPGPLADYLVDARRLRAPIRGAVGEAEVPGDSRQAVTARPAHEAREGVHPRRAA